MMHLVTERSGGVRGDTCTCRQEGKWGGKKEGGGGGNGGTREEGGREEVHVGGRSGVYYLMV